MSSRLEEIQSATSKLESFKLDPRYASNPDMLYAIDENLLFLKAIQSLPRYFAWLVIMCGGRGVVDNLYSNEKD
jgi:hypothetical protein